MKPPRQAVQKPIETEPKEGVDICFSWSAPIVFFMQKGLSLKQHVLVAFRYPPGIMATHSYSWSTLWTALAIMLVTALSRISWDSHPPCAFNIGPSSKTTWNLQWVENASLHIIWHLLPWLCYRYISTVGLAFGCLWDSECNSKWWFGIGKSCMA